MLGVFMQSVFMQSVFMLRFVILSVVAPVLSSSPVAEAQINILRMIVSLM
jgi:hypothetical protein